MNKEQAIEFLQIQIEGIDKVINENKIFNIKSVLRQRQKDFQAVIDLLKNGEDEHGEDEQETEYKYYVISYIYVVNFAEIQQNSIH